MARVRLEGLRKVFDDNTVAVQGLDLEIEDQEFLTLLGPSGCGKSTTLRMIAGLENPTGGDIYFGADRVNDVAPARRNIAMVFQTYALYPHMTVRGNLEYPLKKRRVPAAERGPMVERTARLLQIGELLNRKPRQLSGGQQQRVALGRAIIRDPQVFLLDEPLSNLDAKLRAYMRAELIELRQRIGKTMIYVTHDQLEAMTMSDRIAVMDMGVLQQCASPNEIYNRPVNRFVASFVGTPAMNFLEGSLSGDGNGARFEAPEVTVPLSAETAARVEGTGAVVAGVRAEDVLVGEGDVRATVKVLEAAGYETLVFLEVAGNGIISRTGADLALKAGETVPIGLRESRMHFFDPATGARLGPN